MDRLRTYVINLARSPERLEFMQKQLSRLQIPFERIPAIDATDLGRKSVMELVEPRFAWLTRRLPASVRAGEHGPMIYMPERHRYLVAGEIACYLSHCRAIEAFVATSSPAALILEDDVVLDEDLTRVLDALAHLPLAPRIVKLEGMHHGMPMNMLIARAGAREITFMFKPSTGAAAYYLTREAAQRLSKRHLLPIREQYDSMLRQYWRHGIEVLEVAPFVARQHRISPSIHGRVAQPKLNPPLAHAALLAAAMPMIKAGRILRRLAYLIGHANRLRLPRWHGTGADDRTPISADQGRF